MEKTRSVISRESKISAFVESLRRSCDEQESFRYSKMAESLGFANATAKNIVERYTQSSSTDNTVRRWIGGRSITTSEIAEAYAKPGVSTKIKRGETVEVATKIPLSKFDSPTDTIKERVVVPTTPVVTDAKITVTVRQTLPNGENTSTREVVGMTYQEVLALFNGSESSKG
jgi:hypothetical protein